MQYDKAIIVSDIPRGITKEDLTIHFQRKSNGGGEVNSVIYPLKPPHGNEAMVLFDSRDTVETVTKVVQEITLPGTRRKHPLYVREHVLVFSLVSAVVNKDILATLRTSHWKEFLEQVKTASCLSRVEERDDGSLLLEGNWYQVQNAREIFSWSSQKITEHVQKSDDSVGGAFNRNLVVCAERQMKVEQERASLKGVHKATRLEAEDAATAPDNLTVHQEMETISKHQNVCSRDNIDNFSSCDPFLPSQNDGIGRGFERECLSSSHNLNPPATRKTTVLERMFGSDEDFSETADNTVKDGYQASQVMLPDQGHDQITHIHDRFATTDGEGDTLQLTSPRGHAREESIRMYNLGATCHNEDVETVEEPESFHQLSVSPQAPETNAHSHLHSAKDQGNVRPKHCGSEKVHDCMTEVIHVDPSKDLSLTFPPTHRISVAYENHMDEIQMKLKGKFKIDERDGGSHHKCRHFSPLQYFGNTTAEVFVVLQSLVLSNQDVIPHVVTMSSLLEPRIMKMLIEVLENSLRDIENRDMVHIEYQYQNRLCEVIPNSNNSNVKAARTSLEDMFANIRLRTFDCSKTTLRKNEIKRIAEKFQSSNLTCLCYSKGLRLHIAAVGNFPDMALLMSRLGTRVYRDDSERDARLYIPSEDVGSTSFNKQTSRTTWSDSLPVTSIDEGNAHLRDTNIGQTPVVKEVDVGCNEFLYWVNVKHEDFSMRTHDAKIHYQIPNSVADSMTLTIETHCSDIAEQVLRIIKHVEKMLRERIKEVNINLPGKLTEDVVGTILAQFNYKYKRDLMSMNWYPTMIRLVGSSSLVEEAGHDLSAILEKYSSVKSFEQIASSTTVFNEKIVNQQKSLASEATFCVKKEFEKEKFDYVLQRNETELSQILSDCKHFESEVTNKGTLLTSITSHDELHAKRRMEQLQILYDSVAKRLEIVELCVGKTPKPETDIKQVITQCLVKDIDIKFISREKILIIGPEDEALQTQLLLTEKLQLPSKRSSRHSRNRHANQEQTGTRSTTSPQNYGNSYKSVTAEGIEVLIYTDDITKVAVNAITNAANRHLRHGGGVAGAISIAAGRRFDDESDQFVRRYGALKDSEVMSQNSQGSLLSYEIFHVINAVGPHWSDYSDKQHCLLLLRKTFANVLNEANARLEVRSLAIPLISSGIFGVPKEQCAAKLREAVYDFSKTRQLQLLQQVHLVNIDQETTGVIIDEFKQNEPFAKETMTTPATSNSTFTTNEGIQVSVYTQDITKVKVDAIVNSSNENLVHNQGVSGAIAKAAGRLFDDESKDIVRRYGRLKVSEVCHQDSRGDLLKYCLYVIHAVGPMMSKTSNADACLLTLKHTFTNILHHANTKLEVKSIAIPLISSGAYGVPVHDCARVLRDAICEFSKSRRICLLQDIHVVNNDPELIWVAAREFDVQQRNTVSSVLVAGIGNEQRDWQDKQPQVHRTSKTESRQQPTENKERDEDPYEGNPLMGAHVSEASTSNNEDSSFTTFDPKQFQSKIPAASTQTIAKDDHRCTCPICQDPIKQKKILSGCKHEFCTSCIEKWFKEKPVCPVCGKPYGVVSGNQPRNGKMRTDIEKWSLPGYTHGTIVITYEIPSGIQEKNHPYPGKRYSGTSRTAYLPNSPEGQVVAELLKKAFDERLIFTVGRSVTTGQNDVVTWNDIHHKTNIKGGPTQFGYPDPDYLTRVKDGLKAKGIV